MYIGSTSRKGLNHLIYEIVDNAVDEHLAGYCDTIHVTLEADDSGLSARYFRYTYQGAYALDVYKRQTLRYTRIFVPLVSRFASLIFAVREISLS